MSGIYIPCMKMPKNCAWCRFLQSTDPIPKRELFCGIDTTNNIHDYRPDKGCPLVPVPPHGRLIDADALIDWLYDDEPSPWKAPFRLCTADRSDVKFLLKNAPTIIPAEEEQNERV